MSDEPDKRQERIDELEAVLRVFSVYSSDSWVREQAQEALEAV